LVFDLLPQTITNKIYSEMQKEMLVKFKEKGVDADVQITTSPPSGPPPKKDFLTGAAVGVGATGALYGLWKLIRMAF
jgi:hypothetical protein